MGWSSGMHAGRLRGGERGIIVRPVVRDKLGVHVCVMTKPPSLFEAKDRGVLIRCEFNGSIGRWSLFLAHDNVTRRTVGLNAQLASVGQSLSPLFVAYDLQRWTRPLTTGPRPLLSVCNNVDLDCVTHLIFPQTSILWIYFPRKNNYKLSNKTMIEILSEERIKKRFGLSHGIERPTTLWIHRNIVNEMGGRKTSRTRSHAL